MRFYLGTKDDTDKTPIYTGQELSEGGWAFDFEVPAEKKEANIPILLRKSIQWRLVHK